jgi:pumilio RNA-binding family
VGAGAGAGAGSPPNRGWYRYDATLHQMIGRIVEIAKDRDGSKFIQRRLQLQDIEEMQIVFEETLDGIEELWNDVYGNYILQGFLEFGTDNMRDRLGRKIVESGVFTLSTKVYG